MSNAALLALGGIAGVVVLLALSLCRDSRRREDAYTRLEDEPLPLRDDRVIELWRRERVP